MHKNIISKTGSLIVSSLLVLSFSLFSFAANEKIDQDIYGSASAKDRTTLAIETKNRIASYRRGELDQVHDRVYGSVSDLDSSKITNTGNVNTKDNTIVKALDETDYIKVNFKKWFKNKIQVVYLGQVISKKEFLVTNELGVINSDILTFYSYNPETNIYNEIEASNYYVDDKGILHFTVKEGNYIIISEGPLRK